MTAKERAEQVCEQPSLSWAKGIIQRCLEVHAREAVEAERERNWPRVLYWLAAAQINRAVLWMTRRE